MNKKQKKLLQERIQVLNKINSKLAKSRLSESDVEKCISSMKEWRKGK